MIIFQFLPCFFFLDAKRVKIRWIWIVSLFYVCLMAIRIPFCPFPLHSLRKIWTSTVGVDFEHHCRSSVLNWPRDRHFHFGLMAMSKDTRNHFTPSSHCSPHDQISMNLVDRSVHSTYTRDLQLQFCSKQKKFGGKLLYSLMMSVEPLFLLLVSQIL